MHLSHSSHTNENSPDGKTSVNYIINEKEIIEASKKDISAFKPLFEHYHLRILNYIYQRTLKREVAEEIASTVFYKALLNISKYQHRSHPFGSWLYKIAYNETMQHFRKSKDKRSVVLDENLTGKLMEEVEEGNPELLLENLKLVLETLSPEELEMVDFRYYQKMSFREISYILGEKEGNLKVRMHRLIKKLRNEMTKNHG